MTKNLAGWDRGLRALAGVALLVAGLLVPASLMVRALALAAPGGYLLVSALWGSCLGYRLMGKSTCASAPRPPAR
jgi:hypothetical protein